jgi:putative ABC transport system substrate-binding protein
LVPGPSLGKILELLKAAMSGISRVAILVTPGSRSFWLRGTEEEALALGLQLHVLEGREPQEFESAFATIVGQGSEAVVVPLNSMVYKHRTQIVELATKSRLPTISTDRSFANAGALMTYGVKLPAIYQRAGVYVGKILNGAKPADLPIEQPMQFELVINLKTAKALGLTIPPSLLLLADEVIQ